jgi:hypothetical protein
MSRFRTRIAFVALVATATALAACGGGGSGSDDPQEIVNEATLQGIESGKLDFSLALDVKGKGGGHVDASLSGPFQKEDDEELPELDLSGEVDGSLGGEEVDFKGGLTLLSNKAFVEYSGTEYEVDPTTLSFVKSAIQKQAKKQGEDSEGASGCRETVAELKLADFIDNLREGDEVDVGGTPTTTVSGELDAPGAIEALMEVIDDPACSEQLSAAGQLPTVKTLEKAKRTVEDAVKRAHVVLYVGDDHIVRRISVEAAVEPPKRAVKESGAESVRMDFELTMTGVNEDQTVTAPAQAAPLSDLFLKLGINQLELAGALSGEGGLEGVLESLGESSLGGGPGGEDGGNGQRSYLKCIRDARTAADIQKCVGLLQ